MTPPPNSSHETPALKARDMLAQGNALGVRDSTPEALKGRDKPSAWSRRAFLTTTATTLAATATATLPTRAATPPPTPSPSPLIDCNVTLGHWPFRDLPGKDPAAFAKTLRDRGVTQAWVGNFESLFYRDLATANRLLHEACAKHSDGLLLPVGGINPALPAWQDDLQRCTADHGMKAIRLHPNYHGYKLDDPKFLELLTAAAEKKLLIQISAQMEDERTQHPSVRVAPVDLKPLADALKRVPTARVMVLNTNRVMSTTALQGTNVIIDFAMLEGVGGVENLLKEWPLEQLVFGSHAPLFYFESAKLKLQESELTDAQLKAITHANAQRLLAI